MYFKKILKLSMDNDMTYLKPKLPPETRRGTFGHESKVYLPTLLQLCPLISNTALNSSRLCF